jgi:hypothetical protein
MKGPRDQFWEGYRLMALSQLRLGRIGLACLSYGSRLGAAYRGAIHEDMVRRTSYKYREQIWIWTGRHMMNNISQRLMMTEDYELFLWNANKF